MDLDSLKNSVLKRLGEHRSQHTLGVLETAVNLAEKYQVDQLKAAVAALLHDIAREWSDEDLIDAVQEKGLGVSSDDLIVPALLHGVVGAAVALEKFNIQDPEILAAIRSHTLGRVNMSPLEKVIFLADMIEHNRSYPGVDELRNAAALDLDRAVLLGLDHTLQYVLASGGYLHPATVQARNYLWLQLSGI